MKLNQKLAKKVLAVALTLAMVVTSLFVMPTTANAATGATIGRYTSVKAGTTVKTTVKNLGKNYYAKVSVTGTAKSGVTITRVNGNKVTATTKIQGTGNNIKLNVKNWNVPGKSYKLVVKTYSKKTNKLVRTYTAKSTFVFKTLTKVALDETAEVVVGKTTTLKAVKTPTTATTKLTWSSSDETIATVKNGVVTGVKAGEATITVKSANGKTATCKVTVKEDVATLTGIEATGAKTLTATLSATATVTTKDFTVKKGTATPNINSVKIDGTKVQIILGSKMTAGTYSVTYKEVTKTVDVKDETLTTLAVIGTNLAETAKVTSGSSTTATANIGYKVLNQYGERMNQPGSLIATCTFGNSAVSTTANLKEDGVITVSNIPSALAIYGTKGTMTLVDNKTGVQSSTEIVYSAPATLSEITVKGIYNTSTSKFEDLTAGDSIANHVFVFEAKNQYGVAMDKKAIIADNSKISVNATSVLTNLSIMNSTAPVNSFGSNNLTEVTIEGTTYVALMFKTNNSSDRAVAGTMNLLIVNNTKGSVYSDAIKVADGTSIKTINVSANDTIYAMDENDLNYEILDNNGKAITKYEDLKDIKLTVQTGDTLTWVKKADGTARLVYVPGTTSYTGDQNKLSTVRSITLMANPNTAGVVVATKTFSVYTERKPVAITGYTGSTACSSTSGSSISYSLGKFTIEDQYGNAMKQGQKYFPSYNDVEVSVVNKNSTPFQTRAYTALGKGNVYGLYYFKVGTEKLTGTATVTVGLLNGLDKDKYTFDIYAVDTMKATNLKIAYINYGYAAEVAAGVSASPIFGIKVTGTVDGKTVTIPSSQWVVSSDSYVAIATNEGIVTKKAKAEITVDTVDGNGDGVSTTLSIDYEYSNAARQLAYVDKITSNYPYANDGTGTYTGNTIDKSIFENFLYCEDQYGDEPDGSYSLAGIKYSVVDLTNYGSRTASKITHNNTNSVSITTDGGPVTLSVTATFGDNVVTQIITLHN